MACTGAAVNPFFGHLCPTSGKDGTKYVCCPLFWSNRCHRRGFRSTGWSCCAADALIMQLHDGLGPARPRSTTAHRVRLCYLCSLMSKGLLYLCCCLLYVSLVVSEVDSWGTNEVSNMSRSSKNRVLPMGEGKQSDASSSSSDLLPSTMDAGQIVLDNLPKELTQSGSRGPSVVAQILLENSFSPARFAALLSVPIRQCLSKP